MPKSKVLQIRYRPTEEKYIEKFRDAGFSMGDLVRQWIRENGEKAFPEVPLYAKVAAERVEMRKKEHAERDRIKNMTAEEYVVEVLKGKVRHPEGMKEYAEFRGNWGEIYQMSMANIKEKTPENTPEIARHIQMVNRDYYFANGQAPTEEYYENVIFKDW